MQRQCCNTIPAHERSAVADSEPPAPITFVYGNVGVDASFLRDINDYPVEGVTFRDITPLLGDASAFGRAVDDLVACVHDEQVSRVVGVEARGFILAAPVAYRLRAGFVPVRKPGKLPWAVARESMNLSTGPIVLKFIVMPSDPMNEYWSSMMCSLLEVLLRRRANLLRLWVELWLVLQFYSNSRHLGARTASGSTGRKFAEVVGGRYGNR